MNLITGLDTYKKIVGLASITVLYRKSCNIGHKETAVLNKVLFLFSLLHVLSIPIEVCI